MNCTDSIVRSSRYSNSRRGLLPCGQRAERIWYVTRDTLPVRDMEGDLDGRKEPWAIQGGNCERQRVSRLSRDNEYTAWLRELTVVWQKTGSFPWRVGSHSLSDKTL